MKKILLSLQLLAVTPGLHAQSWQDTVSRIEQLFVRYTANTPGAQLAISRHGQVLFSKAWGMADLEHNIPLSVTSPTEAGSVSKQFTAAAILLLEQQGKLSQDDDIRKYVPELPDYGKVITIRHLLHHTSGVKDWGSIMELANWPRGSRAYTNEYALYVISLQKSLNNEPGGEYIYSNSNFNLQAIIVQRVSNLSLADFTRQYIFEPAGMTHTEWRNNYKKIVKDRAIAYNRYMQGFLTNMPNENAYGNGGLLTTAEDLLTWNNYYLNGRFGTPSLLPKQLETRKLNNGVVNNYAAGLVTDSVDGWQAIAHSGATASYRANLEYFPEVGLSIAWLSNTSAFDGDKLNVVSAVRQLFLPVRKGAAGLPAAEVAVAPAELAAYTGWYRNTRTGGGMKLYAKDGEMSSLFPTGNWKAVGNNAFLLGNTRLEINGKKGLFVVTPIGDKISYERVDAADMSAKNLESYTGTYYSSEAEARYHIVAKAGKLFLEIRPGTSLPLTPTYKDGFESPWGPVYFVRDLKRGVMELTISISRARNVLFRKIYEPGF